MKNKVDITKLIKEKYKDNNLELSDIFDEIDLVLNEVADYSSKIAGQASDAPMEGMSPAEKIASVTVGAPGPRNPVSNDSENRFVGAKLAEAPNQSVQRDVQYTVKVPDLYSLMTNTKSMQPGSEDRKFINDIIKNINAPSNNWLGRVRALQQYTKFLGEPKAQTNISEAISSLILLNVLKKLSFFTDQPGKQFEYVFAPFIHPDAAVAGGEQTEVDDINSPNGKVSLKFLHSKTPMLDVSQTNLETKIGVPSTPWKEGENYPFIDYIIVRCFGNGNIQFGRTGLTNNLSFVKNKYQLVKGQKGTSNVLMALKSADQRGLGGLPGYIIYTGQTNEVPVGGDENAPSLIKSPLAGQNFNIGGIRIKADLGIGKNKIPELGNITLRDYIQRLETEIKSKDTNKITKIGKLIAGLPAYKALSPQEKNSSESIIQIAQDVLDQYKADSRAFASSQQQQRLQRESLQSNKQLLNEDLSISLTSVWNNLIVETLSLGDVDKYNEQQLIVGDTVQKMYVDVLDNLNKLNTNITKYFGTAQGKNEKSGDDAVNNAKQIVSSVTQIQTSKKK